MDGLQRWTLLHVVSETPFLSTNRELAKYPLQEEGSDPYVCMYVCIYTYVRTVCIRMFYFLEILLF